MFSIEEPTDWFMTGIGKILTFSGYSIPHWLEKKTAGIPMSFIRGSDRQIEKPIYYGGRERQALRRCLCPHSQIKIFE